MEPGEVRRWERNLAALIANAGADDPEGFAETVRLIDAARAGLADAAAELRSQGYSWAALAAPLGVTRSAVAQRFGRA
jgi:hypothetical protein